MCNFVCFELSLKTHEGLKLLIFSCTTLFLFKCCLQYRKQICIRDFNPLSRRNDSVALTFSLSSVLKLILSFCMIICRLEISIKFELSFLSFFVSFCRLLHLYRKICLSKWKNCRSIFISCLNSWKAIKIATKINEKQWFLFASNFFGILYPHCCPSKLHRKANEIQIFRIRLLFPFFLSTHCITTGWFSKLHR